MDWRTLTYVFRAAAMNWLRDYAPSMGAALAYYTVFALAPLLLIAISVAGFFFGEEAARGLVFTHLQDLLGDQAALTVQRLIEGAGSPAKSALTAVIGLVILFVGATSVFVELQNDLDRIWGVAHTRLASGLRGLVRSRLLSFAMVLGIGFLLVLSLAASAALTALGRWLHPISPGLAGVVKSVEISLSFVLSTLLFAMIFKTMPQTRIQWRDVWVGAIFTSFLFVAGKFFISIYLGTSSIASGFGAAASLIVVLLWVYYSAQIFLFGAEFTCAYSHTCGSRREEIPHDPDREPGRVEGQGEGQGEGEGQGQGDPDRQAPKDPGPSNTPDQKP